MNPHEGVIHGEGFLSPPEGQAEGLPRPDTGIGVGHVLGQGLPTRAAEHRDHLAPRHGDTAAVQGKIGSRGGNGIADLIGAGLGGLGGGTDVLGQVVEILVGNELMVADDGDDHKHEKGHVEHHLGKAQAGGQIFVVGDGGGGEVDRLGFGLSRQEFLGLSAKAADIACGLGAEPLESAAKAGSGIKSRHDTPPFRDGYRTRG